MTLKTPHYDTRVFFGVSSAETHDVTTEERVHEKQVIYWLIWLRFCFVIENCIHWQHAAACDQYKWDWLSFVQLEKSVIQRKMLSRTGQNCCSTENMSENCEKTYIWLNWLKFSPTMAKAVAL